jgi:nitronate monooxygenase
MPIPDLLAGRLSLPAIGAPMFLVSFPPLVMALCRAGVVGTFPHVNARPSSQLDQWLDELRAGLAAAESNDPAVPVAPFGVNLVCHHSNPRFLPDLAIVVKHRVPLVLTSLGNPAPVAEAVHAYGGVVFSDVVTAAQARKAAAAGVDGLICVGGGAGGHASHQSMFSLVREIREFWDGCLVLGGGINDGWQIRAAEALGADLAYIGTRFNATQESHGQQAFKQMIVDCGVDDLVNTDRFTGVHANFLRPSIERFGIDVATLPPKRPDIAAIADGDAKAWRDFWSAGHGVATIHDIPPVRELVDRMAAEYAAACRLPVSPALHRNSEALQP